MNIVIQEDAFASVVLRSLQTVYGTVHYLIQHSFIASGFERSGLQIKLSTDLMQFISESDFHNQWRMHSQTLPNVGQHQKCEDNDLLLYELVDQIILNAIQEKHKIAAIETNLNQQTSWILTISNHLQSVGLEHIKECSNDFHHLILMLHDKFQTVHYVQIQLSINYPAQSPTVIMDLPTPFKLFWQQDFDLNHVKQQCSEFLLPFSEYTKHLRDIDNNCLFDPSSVKQDGFPLKQSNRHIVVRRIQSHDASNIDISGLRLLVHVDVNQPNDLQKRKLKFYWNDSRDKCVPLHADLSKWLEGSFLRENIEQVWGILITKDTLTVPMSQPSMEWVVDGEGQPMMESSSTKIPESVSNPIECAICYQCELPEDSSAIKHRNKRTNSTGITSSGIAPLPPLLPDITCANRQCGKIFHSYCLIKWIQSLPDHKKSFGVVYGKCPYCKFSIAAKRSR